MLTDKKRLKILFTIFDQDIEEALNLFEKNGLKDLDEDTICKAIILIAPGIKECGADPKDLIELIKERLAVILKK